MVVKLKTDVQIYKKKNDGQNNANLNSSETVLIDIGLRFEEELRKGLKNVQN